MMKAPILIYFIRESFLRPVRRHVDFWFLSLFHLHDHEQSHDQQEWQDRCIARSLSIRENHYPAPTTNTTTNYLPRLQAQLVLSLSILR